MEALPFETQERIFLLACTDGGSTGNSLSLTSKAIRAASRTNRFHTVYLIADIARLASFVALYERECAQGTVYYPPRIRHLFLTFRRKPSSRAGVDQSDIQANSNPPSSYFDAGNRLIRMVALDLYSLVVYTPAQSLRKVVHFPVLQCPLPALREATFIDLCDPGPLIAHSTDTRPLLPSLTHLHLVIGASELALNQWAAHGPCVTHLRVTGVADSKQVHPLASAVGVRADLGRFSRALQGSLDPPQTVHGSEFPSRTYPSLKFLLMQPRPTTNGGWCGYNAIDRSRMVFGLQQIEDGCREKWGSEPEVTSILLQELSKNAFREKNTSGIQRQWRNRVEGGEGCWIGLT